MSPIALLLLINMKSDFKNRQDRLDRMLALLRGDQLWTTDALGVEFAVSKRTVLRDIQLLKQQGYPIDTEQGVGGGVTLSGTYGVSKLMLTNEEVLNLIVSLVVTESLNTPLLSNCVTSVRQKIGNAFPHKQRGNINKLRQRVLVGKAATPEVIKTYEASAAKFTNELSAGFFDLRQVLIEYRSEKGEVTERIIEPHYFLLNWPVWYVVGWDHLRLAPRMFRVDRVLKSQVLTDRFQLRSKSFLLEGFEQYFKVI